MVETRPATEVLVFKGIDCFATLIRIFIIAYFLSMVYRLATSGGDKDRYTIVTLTCLSISTVSFVVYQVVSITQVIISALSLDGSPVDVWYKEHDTLLRIVKALSRPLIGYFLQSTAFIVNLQRWRVILQGVARKAQYLTQIQADASSIEDADRKLVHQDSMS